MLPHKGLSDFWSFACITGGSLPYNTQCHKATVAVIWFYINLTELKLNLVFQRTTNMCFPVLYVQGYKVSNSIAGQYLPAHWKQEKRISSALQKWTS